MLKVGVFGVGHLGKYHLNNWKEIPEVELVGFLIQATNMHMRLKKPMVLKDSWMKKRLLQHAISLM